MPLYSDSNYYYSGGSSQLYSPYYTPGLYPGVSSSSSIGGAYAPYSSAYNRSIGGSYIVPLTTSRSPAYSSASSSAHHGLSSRYQPKLTTITETSPLISSSRLSSGLIPLTRIQSPKISSYSSTTSSSLGHTKYIPPRPKIINTADIDVSASRYRRERELQERERRKQEMETTSRSPSSSVKRQNSLEQKKEPATAAAAAAATATEVSEEPGKNRRSTIKRNRPMVRLSTVRSRSKNRSSKSSSTGTEELSPEPQEKLFKDLPPPPEVNMSWRQKLAEDLAAIPVYPPKKSPGELIRERFLIQEAEDTRKITMDSARTKSAVVALTPDETLPPLIVEMDPVDHTIRRLSIPQCPSFHDICEDISSDKIDDDLNAGELRRRASIIQEQEQEILNQLQKSASGTFQLIHLERRSSIESVGGSGEESARKSLTKRKSKKSKKIRHKITAIVEIENSPLTPIIQERDEDLRSPSNFSDEASKPKFTFNVDAVEEHHEIHKVFKLPKKRQSVKKTALAKSGGKMAALPEGFMHAQPKEKVSPPRKEMKKEKTYVSTAEIFTFPDVNDKAQEAITAQSMSDMKSTKAEKNLPTEKFPTTPTTPKADLPKTQGVTEIKKPFTEAKIPLSPNLAKKEFKPKDSDKTTTPSLKASTSVDSSLPQAAATAPKISDKFLQKSQSLNIETPVTLKSAPAFKPILEEKAKSVDVIAEKPKVATEAALQKSSSSPSAVKQIQVSAKPTSMEKAKEGTTKVLEPKVIEPKVEKNLKTGDTPTPPLQKTATVPKTPLEAKAKSVDVPPSQEIKKATPSLLEKAQSQSLNVENSQAKVATPKPIKKAVQRSDSGEDFWAQIGPRESLYMTNRQKALLESQWQKREDLLEAQTTDDVKNLNKIKTAVSCQKEEALKKANNTRIESEGVVDRSHSNESSLSKKSPQKEATKAEKVSPKKKKISSPKKKMAEAVKTPEVAKPKGIATVAEPPQTPPPATATVAATATTSASAAKINSGLAAKSPEQQEEARMRIPETGGGAKNKQTEDKTSKTTTAAATPPMKTATASASTVAAIAEAKVNKSTEIDNKKSSDDPKSSTLTDIKASGVPPPPPTTATANKTKVTNKTTTATTAAAASAAPPSATPINADHFVTLTPTPAAPNRSPPKNKTNASPTTAVARTVPAATTVTAAGTTIATNTILSSKIATTNTSTAYKPQAQAQAETIAISPTTPTTPSTPPPTPSEAPTRGNNLSKFATVLNLAQCLQDVDADLDDYIPSSAENSDDGSSCDDSSPDGCENLSASMKKKLKQRRKKEKEAEKAKFDPHKKIKIDPTNKCYVKDEAPRFPLVATPRPLWKREKIVYPEESSEDSDSDASGSTEETTTDDSEASSDSDAYEDELIGASGESSSAASKDNNAAIIRMSTCSNDSGFEGGTAPSTPKKALGAREARDSPCTPPSSNPAYKIDAENNGDEEDETSHTYTEFQKSGRFTPPATVIPRFKNYSVDDFHFLAVLGKGSFGKVLLAELRDTTYYYAIKCLKKDVVLEDDDVDSTLIERKVLALGTKHPYLCHLFCTFQTESHLFFVMEYLNGGDLMFHIQESGRFTEERARFYGAEIISGLKFLHKKGIIYRDLKLDNVLLDYEGHVRIADFGMCKLQIYLDKTADSFCGTPDYMAPEIIKGEKYNQNVDWWSFGVLLYEMLIGQSPFSGCDEDELFWSICNEIPWFPVYISVEATSILKGLLEKDYTKRIGSQYSLAGDVTDHIFFRPIDWNALEKRQLQPPFKPQVKHPLDTQYFDRVFTRERVRLTPIDKEILQSMDQKQFAGFTYTNPHITLE